VAQALSELDAIDVLGDIANLHYVTVRRTRRKGNVLVENVDGLTVRLAPAPGQAVDDPEDWRGWTSIVVLDISFGDA
jgi:hypothetical protein